MVGLRSCISEGVIIEDTLLMGADYYEVLRTPIFLQGGHSCLFHRWEENLPYCQIDICPSLSQMHVKYSTICFVLSYHLAFSFLELFMNDDELYLLGAD